MSDYPSLPNSALCLMLFSYKFYNLLMYMGVIYNINIMVKFMKSTNWLFKIKVQLRAK